MPPAGLHDTVEDTETTADELPAMIGAKVASVVMEVTDNKSLENRSWRPPGPGGRV